MISNVVFLFDNGDVMSAPLSEMEVLVHVLPSSKSISNPRPFEYVDSLSFTIRTYFIYMSYFPELEYL